MRRRGGGASEARRNGASLGQQLLYGAGSAALAAGTEQISNVAGPLKKMFGEGVAEKIGRRLVEKYGGSAAVRIVNGLSKTAVGRIALSGLGEGVEEFVAEGAPARSTDLVGRGGRNGVERNFRR